MKPNEHLFHFLPFLRNDYRDLRKAELKSEKVFKELFPDETVIDLSKLEQIYRFQKKIVESIDVKITETPTEIVVDYGKVNFINDAKVQ